MDFIKKLLSSSVFDIIFVIVNWLSKQAIFILISNTITFAELAKLFIINIFSKHRVLSHMTFNGESKFISNLFHFLGTTLNIYLHFTLDYYLKEMGR